MTLEELMRQVKRDINTGGKDYMYNIFNLKLSRREEKQLQHEIFNTLKSVDYAAQMYSYRDGSYMFTSQGKSFTIYSEAPKLPAVVPQQLPKRKPTITQAARIYSVVIISEFMGVQLW